MQFKEGVTVYTRDDEAVGDIDRVVLDPRTDEITHLVVRKGFLLPEDKLIPVDWVETADEERVTLSKGSDELGELPRFEEMHYVEAKRSGRAVEGATAAPGRPPGYVAPLYWYPPHGIAWWSPTIYPIYPQPPYVLEARRNIPEDTVPLREGAQVIAADGKRVGDVERVLADPKEERATHLVISHGFLLKERKAVPTTWIDKVGENQVWLSVKSEVFEDLPEYEGEPA